MNFTEIDKALIELCDLATSFYSNANSKVTGIVEALGDKKTKIHKDDWRAAKDAVDAYADGMNLIMSGLFDYVHRKVESSKKTDSDATE